MSARPTRWSLIGAVLAGEPAAEEAFVARYRPPVERFLRQRGLGAEAEDVAQDVFVRLLAQGALERASRERGSFRSYLYAVTRNALGDHVDRRQALKRGGGVAAVPLPEDVSAGDAGDLAAFDREWLRHLIELVFQRLQREHPTYFEAVHAYLVEERPQPELAAELGRSVQALRNHVHRGRQKLLDYLREEVARYERDPQRHRTEVETLAKLLAAGRR